MKLFLTLYGFYVFFLPTAIIFLIIEKVKKNKERKAHGRVFNTVYWLVSLVLLSGISLLGSSTISSTVEPWWLFTAIEFVIVLSIAPILSRFLASAMLKLKKFFSKRFADNKYGIALFLLFLTDYIIEIPLMIDYWSGWSYASSYSLGFGSRFFIGSLLYLIFPKFLSRFVAHIVYGISSLITAGLISYMLNRIIYSVDSSKKSAVLFLTACFFACPGTLRAMWNSLTFGRMDMFTLMFCILGIMCFEKIKRLELKYIVLTLFGCICNLTYHGFMFMYFPMMFTIIMFDIIEDGKIKRKNRDYGVTSCLVMCASFLMVQFGKSITPTSPEKLTALLEQRTDIPINTEAIEFEFYKTFVDSYEHYAIPTLSFEGMENPRIKSFILIIFLFPLLMVLFAFVAETLSDIKPKELFLSPFFWGMLSLFSALPQFIINIDWGRWYTALFICTFFIILYSIYKKYDRAEKAAQKLSRYVKAHPAMSVSVIIYLMIFSTFVASAISGDVYKLEYVPIIISNAVIDTFNLR